MVEKTLFKASAALIPTDPGNPFIGSILDQQYQALGLTPEKLQLPKNYQDIIKMCYEYYHRGGIAARVIERVVELTITDIRNGQRKTSDEANNYFNAVLHSKPSRLMRFIRTAALEYFLSGMVLPKVDWVEKKGSEISPDLIAGKTYFVPVFDLFPPQLVVVTWSGWGARKYWLKVSDTDKNLIRSKGGHIKEQQLQYQSWVDAYPAYVTAIQQGADKVDITNQTDPILRKEVSFTPYPTPYLYPILEPLLYKDQLRRMDFAVASRVVNAILLVTVGSDEFPVTEENQDIVDNLKQQLLARSGNPAQMERLFTLFADHTTKLQWIAPDVQALLNQQKYSQVNEEFDEGLGFSRILLTGTSRGGSGGSSEVSTWAIQPQMEELRSMLVEWMGDSVYNVAADLNKFKRRPEPEFKPIKLQDFVKTASVYAQLFKEGNISRTSRVEMSGLNLETETENMKDESELLDGLPAFPATPYSPPPPIMGPGGQPKAGGRPLGSQNVPINNRNSGVKPSGQNPTSRIAAESADDFELMSDSQLIDLVDKVLKSRGIQIGLDDILPIE